LLLKKSNNRLGGLHSPPFFQWSFAMSNTAKSSQSWNAMLAALRFALPYMEDLAGSSDNKGEKRAVKLMRDAISEAEKD
jgi:hypothetical protein